jgi:hypothetical protein
MDCDAVFKTICTRYPHSDKSLADLVELGPDAAVYPAVSGESGGGSAGTAGETAAGVSANPTNPAATANIDERSHDCSAAPRGAGARHHAMPVLLLLFALAAAARRATAAARRSRSTG